MIKIYCILASLFFASLIQAREIKKIKGSGYVLTQQRALDGYNGISACRDVRIVVVQGELQPVMVETDNNLFPYIKTVVRDHILKAYIPDSIDIVKYADMNVLLSMPSLVSLSATTGSAVDASPQRWETDTIRINAASGSHIRLHLTARRVKITAQTSAWIILKGEVGILDADLNTGARLDASELKTANASIRMATGAEAKVTVSDTLSYNLLGNAKLTLRGDPEILHSESLSGSKFIHER